MMSTGGPITVMADGILKSVEAKRKGHQLIIGAEYTVNDFISELANKEIKIKTNKVVLMLGNEFIDPGKNVNVAKQMQKLITQVWIVRPTASVFVCSLMPHPTQETDTKPIIMKANTGLSNLCKRLNKHQENLVKYLPIHTLVLEKCSHSDETGVKRIITRIKQPHGVYYKPGSDVLNQEGAELVLNEIDRLVENATKPPLMERMGLYVEVENDQYVGSGSEKRKESEPQAKMPKKRKESDEDHTNLAAEKLPKSRNIKDPNIKVKTPLWREGSKKKDRGGGQVAVMVDKWEKLSQGGPSALDSLDLELGGDAVVRVDLGDYPRSVDNGSDDDVV